MRGLAKAALLGSALVLLGQSAAAQDQPPANVCGYFLGVAMGTRLAFLDMLAGARENNTLTYQAQERTEGGLVAIDIMIDRTGCSTGLWRQMKQCATNSEPSLTVRTVEGRAAISQRCVAELLKPYVR